MDFGDEMAAQLIQIGRRVLDMLGRKTWDGTKSVVKSALNRSHEMNNSIASEMNSVIEEADSVLKSPACEDGRLYDLAGGATFRRNGEDVVLSFDFTDNMLPDGTAIDDFEKAEKSIIAQLEASGAPEFAFQIREGEGTLVYKYADQEKMVAAMKDTQLSFASVLTQAKARESEMLPVESLADKYLADRGQVRHVADLTEKEFGELCESTPFTEAMAKEAQRLRENYKACGVDVRVRYMPLERQFTLEYPKGKEHEFAAASEKIGVAKRDAARAKAEKEKRARRNADARGRETFREKAERATAESRTRTYGEGIGARGSEWSKGRDTWPVTENRR